VTRKRSLFAPFMVFVAALAAGCDSSSGDGGQPSPVGGEGIDFPRVAEILLERLDLQPGERVLLVGLPGRFDPLFPLLREGVAAAAAEDLGAWAVEGSQPATWSTDFTRGLEGLDQAEAAMHLADVDAALMLPGANTGHLVYAAMQDVLRGGSGRTVHFHWLGAYHLDGTEREIDPMVDAFYQRVLAETSYEALSDAQARFERAMRGATVRVTTPAGTDISFQIGDRPVTRQDGDASAARAERARNLIDREVELPAGAVRVAPIEESVNGTIVFPPSVWNGQRTEDLTLVFEEGTVISLDASMGADGARAEIDAAGDAGRAFREFALGFNPLLAIPSSGERWIPYYGYGAGVVRLSLGDNTELGGAVGGGYVRWNFFVDATVTVDGDVWVDGGQMLSR
jgi:leucyl aminopeptidase (aminopeptidase T)